MRIENEECPFLEDFKKYAAELTARHDRHERLVRISRDVTIESKRIIFYLHSLKNCETANLTDADGRIAALTRGPLKKAAVELKADRVGPVNVPRMLAPGVEELSEAFCLLSYMRGPGRLAIPAPDDLQKMLSPAEGADSVDPAEPYLRVNPVDFMLGVMDFTGELMRMCINNASSDDSDSCFSICRLMQEIYVGFLGVSYNKDLHKKMSTLKQSLQKVEEACYKLKLRNLQL